MVKQQVWMEAGNPADCLKLPLLFAIFIMALCSSLMAQSTIDGAIGGSVVDPQRLAVPGASLTVRNNGTNVEQSVTTDAIGRFRITALRAGTYTVTAAMPGFKSWKSESVVVEVGLVTNLEIALALGSQEEVVTVSGEAPVINTEQADFSANINQTSINELPINGRRWSNFALLSPGATPDGDFGLISFRGISGLLNNNTVDGGDNNQAFFSEERGRTRISYVISQDTVREFQVNTSNFSAEYGRAAGGVVNAITKSGTNEIHGSGFWYIRDNKLGARNAFAWSTRLVDGALVQEPLKPTDRRQQFGASLGGPIIKDRLFFFFSWDQQKRNYPGVAAFGSPQLIVLTAADQATLTSRGVTNAQRDAGLSYLTNLTGVVPRTGDQLILFPKIDWRFVQNHNASFSWNRMRWNSPAGIQSQPVVSRGVASWGDDFVEVDFFNARLTSILGPKITNEFRFQWGRDLEYQNSQPPGPGEPTTGLGGRPPSMSISNLSFTTGKPNFLERTKYPQEDRSQWTDTVNLAAGKALWKFGIDVNYIRTVSENLFQEGGVYSYNNVVDFITDYSGVFATGSRGRYSSYNQGFGPPGFKFVGTDINAFLQSDWRVKPGLTLSMGLRYEYQALPDPQIPNPLLPDSQQFPSDKNNFGPRVGAAWDISSAGKYVVRGGYGIYYGRMINSTLYNSIANTGMPTGQRQFTFRPTDAGSPVYPNTLQSVPTISVAAGDVNVYDPNFSNPMIHQADAVFEWQFARNTVISASYLYSAGRDLPTFIDLNLNQPTASTLITISGGPLDGKTFTVPRYTGTRPNTSFARILSTQSIVESTYHGFVLQFNRRMTGGVQFQNSYTLSKATDTGQVSQTFTGSGNVLDPFDLSKEKGPSNFDARHRFVSSVVWQPEFKTDNRALGMIVNGFTLSPIFTVQSGRRYSGFTSGNLSGATTTGPLGAGQSGRTPFLERNSYKFPYPWNLDLRLSRRFRVTEQASIEFLAEAFNLANRLNVTAVNTTEYRVSASTATTATFQYQPAFGTATAAGNTVYRERQIQFAIRVRF